MAAIIIIMIGPIPATMTLAAASEIIRAKATHRMMIISAITMAAISNPMEHFSTLKSVN